MLGREFYQNSPFMKSFYQTIMGKQQRARVYTPEMYFKVIEGINAMMIDKFFNEIPEWDVTLQSYYHLGAELANLDLRKKEDRDFFVEVFPRYIMDIKAGYNDKDIKIAPHVIFCSSFRTSSGLSDIIISMRSFFGTV